MASDRENVLYTNNFVAAGSDTISIPSTHFAQVRFMDIGSANLCNFTVMSGATYQVIKGSIEANTIQLKFGEGRGSGGADDDIVITVDAACSVSIGYTKFLEPNP